MSAFLHASGLLLTFIFTLSFHLFGILLSMLFCFGGVFRRSGVLLCGFILRHTFEYVKPQFQKYFAFVVFAQNTSLKIMQFAHGVIDNIYYIANFI